MRNLLRVPSPKIRDFIVEGADWVETNCFFRDDRNVAMDDLARALTVAFGIKDQKAQELAEDVFEELADRIISCGIGSEENAYPFSLNVRGNLLTLNNEYRSNRNYGSIYVFLLLVTRGDMDSTERVLRNIDPTKAFEALCSEVLARFWAAADSLSGSLIFGTARKKSTIAKRFRDNIDTLCKNIGEGAGWKEGAVPPAGGDAKLDAVVWRKFSDQRSGGLVGFAQCKTGVNWKDHLTKLQPEAFTHRFMIAPLVLPPVRIFMVPSRIHREHWDNHMREGGLLFDRCRITQYAEDLSSEILRKCKTWTNEIIRRQKRTKSTKLAS